MILKHFYIILLVIALIVSTGLTLNHYKYLFTSKPNPSGLGYVQVKATITNVLASGRGIKMSTLLMVRYKYEGREFSGTIRLSGYAEGRFKKGDTILRWIDPAKPETLIGEK